MVIIYASLKAHDSDWASTLTAKDFELIERGTADIKNARIFSHNTAMKKINVHIRAKNT